MSRYVIVSHICGYGIPKVGKGRYGIKLFACWAGNLQRSARQERSHRNPRDKQAGDRL